VRGSRADPYELKLPHAKDFASFVMPHLGQSGGAACAHDSWGTRRVTWRVRNHGAAFGGAALEWPSFRIRHGVLLLWFSFVDTQHAAYQLLKRRTRSTSSVFLLRWPVHASVDRLSVGCTRRL